MLARYLICLATSVILISAATAADVDVPPLYSSRCSSCHGTPPGVEGKFNMPNLGGDDRLGADAALHKYLQEFVATSDASGIYRGTSPMQGVLNINEVQLIREYLITVRDALVFLDGRRIYTSAEGSHTFTTPVQVGSSSDAVTIRIANTRAKPLQVVGLAGAMTHLSISRNTCIAPPSPPSPPNPPVVAGSAGTIAEECEIDIKFSPAAGTNNGDSLSSVIDLNLRFAAGQTPSDVQYRIRFTGTSAGPPPVGPIFSTAGFDALRQFSAPPDGSDTLCPTIQNAGDGILTLDFSVLQANDEADHSSYFEWGDNARCSAAHRPCNASIGSPISGETTLRPADSACTLAIRFNPSKFGEAGRTGARNAMLRVIHNAPTAGTVADFLMTGDVATVNRPRIGLFTSPSAVAGRVSPPAFAAQPINTTSAPWNELLVFNTGTADGLDLNPVTSTNPDGFALTDDCASAPPLPRITSGSNAPNCAITLRFTPRRLGQSCTTVTISAAVSSNGAQAVEVCGNGVAVPGPLLTLSRESIDFGRRAINGAFLPEPVVIGNGEGASSFLRINTVSLSGGGFVIVPDPATQSTCDDQVLAPGASCTVYVQFTPDPTRPEASYSGSLQINTDAPSAPTRTVGLSAVAGTLESPPVLVFADAPGPITFAGFVIAGQQSERPGMVVLRNAGSVNAGIHAIRMVGADASNFSVSGCPAVMFPGGSCVISVQFVPGSGGAKHAQLEVVSSFGIPPPLVAVSGRAVGGTSAHLTASSSSMALGSVRVGAQSAPLELRLASAGDGVLEVTAISADAPFSVQSKTCPTPPFTLTRGSDCTVSVMFTPTDGNAATGMLRVSTDLDAKALEVPLAGSGQERTDVSSGGCSIASGDALADPTLWALVLLAAAAVFHRRRTAARVRCP
ncbi:choice-of-anchor D domain-containing protein [Ramlibacter sp. AW1]|uniref:Choice-of-anchor D domain-containing protein n=1 Tax=Ramlibacter aurantiacus TaxID=2801330 RepID=A0A936ZDK8_9BURK|nr:choice-of-anchor D domain-containing protein [Ramlibacter aurantiacus]MBL0419634.1 choice-of-anchor D domain-containing protein [Ramlibacter aurantiacus]